MKKTEKLNALFDKWQNKQKVEPPDSLKNTKIESNKILPEKFCKDGIVSENTYLNEKIKILIISNEANDEDYAEELDTDRRNDFKTYYESGIDNWKGKMRERYCEMYKLITGNRQMETSDAAIHFAVMNINKRGGGNSIGCSGNKGMHIEKYCEYYKKEIWDEIEIIDPDIIIWSAINTFYLVESVLGAKKINGKTVLEINEKVIRVIRMWHASYYQGRIEPLPEYKNKIIGKLMAKLKNELDAIGWTY